MADWAKRKWLGSESASRAQLEKTFWEIVEGSAGEIEVIYGSDLDTSIYGSRFPRVTDQRPESVDPNLWDEYCDSLWNLNNLPKLKGSMLRIVHKYIIGVMVPWLYVGMLTAFVWHFEGHCFYSMNYHHWGEPKCRYGIPASEADAFEKIDLDSKASPYLERELLRIYTKERIWRGLLWRKDIIKSTLMCPWKWPEYVGTEEDPMCIICRQYLYLSAVVCSCREAALYVWSTGNTLVKVKPENFDCFIVIPLYDLFLTLDRNSSG